LWWEFRQGSCLWIASQKYNTYTWDDFLEGWENKSSCDSIDPTVGFRAPSWFFHSEFMAVFFPGNMTKIHWNWEVPVPYFHPNPRQSRNKFTPRSQNEQLPAAQQQPRARMAVREVPWKDSLKNSWVSSVSSHLKNSSHGGSSSKFLWLKTLKTNIFLKPPTINQKMDDSSDSSQLYSYMVEDKHC
jgi:hypothetical protein